MSKRSIWGPPGISKSSIMSGDCSFNETPCSSQHEGPFPWDDGFEIDHKEWESWAKSCGLDPEDFRGIPLPASDTVTSVAPKTTNNICLKTGELTST